MSAWQDTIRYVMRHARTVAVAAAALALAAATARAQVTPRRPSPPPNLHVVDTTPRPFLLSAGAIQNWPGEEPFSQLTHPPDYTFADLARDVDVAALFVEHYGLPWDEFAASADPPADHNWTAIMTRLAEHARATGKPLSLQMVLSRDKAAGKAVSKPDGRIEVLSDWSGACYSFKDHPDSARAYVNYVAWMVRTFQPKYVNVAVEIDKAYRACGAGPAWDGIVDVERRAYDAARAAKADVVAYFSVNAEDLYNESLTGFDRTLYDALSNLKRDRFGLSTYPSGTKLANGSRATPADIPDDYFTRARTINPQEARILIAETGWNSRDLKVGPPAACVTIAGSSDAMQDNYLQTLLRLAGARDIELVTWWSQRDILPAEVMDTCYPDAPPPGFTGCGGDLWCLGINIYRRIAPSNLAFGDVVFKGFGSMGLYQSGRRPQAGAAALARRPRAPGGAAVTGPTTILVTGGAGFIGANFLRMHVPRLPACEFVNVDALTYAANLASLEEIAGAPNYRFVRADIGDAAAVDALFDEQRPDAVIHFAAESHVDRSIAGPRDFVRTNIEGTFNLLEAARRTWPRGGGLFHHVSTDEVYGSLGESGLFTEETRYDPSSPYSASKAASDHLVRAYHRTFGLPVKITNCSNNYGPLQFPEKLIPLMILNAIEGQPLPVYGEGLNVRDWVYVEDHCEAIWAVFARGAAGETYNIGSNTELRNIDVVRRVCAIVAQETGRPADAIASLITYVKDRPGHDLRYAIDASKIRRELGWAPRETFDSGLRRTVRWYLEHAEWVERVRTGEYRRWIDVNYGQRA